MSSILCVLFPIKCCLALSDSFILSPVFYNSGDPELKDLFGPSIVLNTVKCNGFNFSYSASVIAKRISDNSNLLITNFPIPVNGVTTSNDYLSISIIDYKDSPYIVSVTLTVTRSD